MCSLSKKHNELISSAAVWKKLAWDIFRLDKKLPSLSWKESFALSWTRDMRLRHEIQQEGDPDENRHYGGCRPAQKAPGCPTRVLPVVKSPFEPIQGFSQHPNSKSDLVVQFHAEFDQGALEDFMRIENMLPTSYTPSQISGALIRYKCFMYLHKLYPDSLFVPTLDIEMVWRSHCIRPSMYKRDCEANSGKIIPHQAGKAKVALLEIQQPALLETVKLWKLHFNSDYITGFEPDSLPTSMQGALDRDYWFESGLEWECIPEDQKVVEVQVSLNEADLIEDRKWFVAVEKAVEENVLRIGLKLWPCLMKSYERYLFMYLITPSDQLANPTLLIDMAWHAHMQDPEAYIKDMMNIVGEVLDHDPSLPQTPSRIQATSQAWQDQFGAKYEEEHELVRHLPGEEVRNGRHPRRRGTKRVIYPVAVVIDLLAYDKQQRLIKHQTPL
eukprot:TRINITY_DN14645_c0_g1_i1.p1 TRINITY_DN14645_c0_g1~~TRINITY_DN14645_c0_g1_i1.p1  ORF type:complete len:472 (-),score=103.16 TRINITY_DN14645_c0_g1_i1:134-1459(-)